MCLLVGNENGELSDNRVEVLSDGRLLLLLCRQLVSLDLSVDLSDHGLDSADDLVNLGLKLLVGSGVYLSDTDALVVE